MSYAVDKPALDYEISVAQPLQFALRRSGILPIVAHGIGDFLFHFDKDFIVELQRRRSDLYVVHSAVLSRGDQACLVCGPSGRGKSTLTWALTHHGMGYLSDELAPINLDTMSVLPFPRALSLKHEPPGSYPVGDGALKTEWSRYIGAKQMPGPVVSTGEYRLKAAFFLMPVNDFAHASELCEPISKSEACMHLYANALNQLAHPSAGLEAAHAIVRNIPSYRLGVGDLDAMCAAVTSVMND